MATSSLVSDYIGAGTHAARPATPSVPTGCTALYYETDTLQAFAWNPAGPAWVRIDGGGGGVPSVVQTALNAGAAINSATFGVAPTNGNLLVAFIITAAVTTVGSGWTKFFPLNGSGVFFADVCVKIAGAGESVTQSPVVTAANNTITIFECANSVPGPPLYHDSGAATNVTAANAFGTGEIIIGVCCNESTNTLPTGITGATAGATFAGTATSVAAFTKSAPTRGLGANSITVTYALATSTKTATLSIGAA